MISTYIATVFYVPPVPDTRWITLAEARAQIRYEDDDQDAFLDALIAAAGSHIEHRTGHLVKGVRQRVWRAPPDVRARLDVVPVVSVDAVAFDGGTDEETFTDWRLRKLGRGVAVVPTTGATWPCGWTEITYTGGYTQGEVPDDLKRAGLLLIGHWFAHREVQVGGAISGALAFTVDTLLAPYMPGPLG